MRTPAQLPPRWPKGPFPEKYRFERVEARLCAEATSEGADAAVAQLVARGASAYPSHADPYVRLFLARAEALELARLRRELAALPVVLFRFRTSSRDDVVTEREGPVLGMVATNDPIDAVVAVGTAGPQHGIGTAALVRFLVALRTFAHWSPDALGEESLGLSVTPRDDEAALRIAERVLKICPPLERQGTSPATLAARMLTEHLLDLPFA